LPSHLRIAGVCAVHGEYRFNAALPIDGELLGEVCLTVRIGHSPGSKQEQLAKVTLI
jgi:hypothetical protein